MSSNILSWRRGRFLGAGAYNDIFKSLNVFYYERCNYNLTTRWISEYTIKILNIQNLMILNVVFQSQRGIHTRASYNFQAINPWVHYILGICGAPLLLPNGFRNLIFMFNDHLWLLFHRRPHRRPLSRPLDVRSDELPFPGIAYWFMLAYVRWRSLWASESHLVLLMLRHLSPGDIFVDISSSTMHRRLEGTFARLLHNEYKDQFTRAWDGIACKLHGNRIVTCFVCGGFLESWASLHQRNLW